MLKDKFKEAVQTAAILTDSLMHGLKTANDEMTGGENEQNGLLPGHTINVAQESQSVYADMLRGEVTQQVKELRHEMYMAERKSHEYEYAGNGRVKKRKPVNRQNIKVDMSDGLEPYIIQRNREDTGGVESALENVSANATKDRRDFTIQIVRDFIPMHRIEEWTQMIVVKKHDDGVHATLDIYVSKYESQFNRRHRPFLNEVKYVMERGKASRSEIIEMKGLRFTTFNAFGSDDLKIYEFGNISYESWTEYDGYYILRFSADFVKDGEDPIMEKFFDEITAKKSEEHAPREGRNLNFLDTLQKDADEDYDSDTALELSEQLSSRSEEYEREHVYTPKKEEEDDFDDLVGLEDIT